MQASRWSVAICVVVLALFAGSTAVASGAAQVDVAKVVEALKRTEKAFSGKEVHGDAGFLITQAVRRRGGKLPLRPLSSLEANRDRPPYDVEWALWELRNSPVPRLSYALPERRAGKFDASLASSLVKRSGGVIDMASLKKKMGEQGQEVLVMMANVMKCDGSQSPTDLVGHVDYEYISTHQLFGLLLATQRNCMSRSVLSQSLGSYVGRVRDEFELQLNDKVLTDLQIERAAVLSMAGRPDLVPAGFILRVLNAQGADGIWRLKDPLVVSGFLPPEHATALAYFLLAFSAT